MRVSVPGRRPGSSAWRSAAGCLGIVVAASIVLAGQPADASTQHPAKAVTYAAHRQAGQAPTTVQHDKAQQERAKQDRHDKAQAEHRKHQHDKVKAEHRKHQHDKAKHDKAKHDRDCRTAANQQAERNRADQAAAAAAAQAAAQAQSVRSKNAQLAAQHQAAKAAIARSVAAKTHAAAAAAAESARTASQAGTDRLAAVRLVGLLSSANSPAATAVSPTQAPAPTAKVRTPNQPAAAPPRQGQASAGGVLDIPTQLVQAGMSVGAGPAILLSLVLIFGVGLVVAGTQRRVSRRAGSS